jgi:predicted permease
MLPMNTLINDIKYAFRQLRKNPGFTAVAVLTLALGIGANTTVFNLINTFLLRPMIGQREGELVQCYNRDAVRPDTYRAFSYPNYVDLRERNQVFLHLLAYELMEVGVMEGDISRRVLASMVSANYFSTFGVTMARGRAFLSEEEQPDSAIPVVILSHAAWTDGGADPDIIGKTLRIQSRTYTIVGVAPRGFAGAMSVMSPYLWLPLGMRDALRREVAPGESAHLNDRHQHCLLLVGQLKHGVNRARAESELRVLAGQLERAFPAENKDQTIDVHPLPRLTIGPWPEVGSAGRAFVVGRITPMLLAVAGAVLLISCLNLANLLLSRGTVRRREIALRLALGAKRRHVVRQLLTEAFVLSLLGGAAGLFLAFWLTRLFAIAAGSSLPYVVVFKTTPDLRVLAATLGFCGLSVLLFGLGPAWRLSHPVLVTDLKEQLSRPVSSGSGRRLLGMRGLLVVGQLAISLSLLTAAGLFIRGAINAASADPGFALKDGLVVEVDPVLAGYDEVRNRQLYRALIQRLHSLPGVEDVSLAASVPFGRREWRDVRRAGVAPAVSSRAESVATGRSIGADHNVIGADYFRTVGLPLIKGREFSPSEMEPSSASRVAVIDRELANQLWPGEEALGRSLQIESQVPGEDPRVLEVVGIVPTLRNSLIEPKPVPHLYVPWGFEYQPKMHIHLRLAPRGRQNELALLRTVREEVRAVDAGWPVISLKTLADLPKGTRDLWLVKTGAQMFIVFGGLALVLASVGMYGVKSFTTARRTREIGIRMALGATAPSVIFLILREGLILTAVGLGCGMLLAGAAGRLLSSLLYGVSPLDPWVFGLAPVFLTGTALLACYLPARRAAKIDPMKALRYE